MKVKPRLPAQIEGFMGAKFMRPLNERGSAPQGLGGIEIIFVGPVFFALNIDTPNRMDGVPSVWHQRVVLPLRA